MKKNILVVSLLSAILLLTGCGSNKEALLRCKATKSGVDVGFNVGFKGSKVVKMDLSYDMDLSQYSDAQIDLVKEQDFCSSVKSSMKEYEEAFVNCKQEVSNKHLLVTSDLDVDKVAKNELQKFATPEDTKKELEKTGYTCTIE